MKINAKLMKKMKNFFVILVLWDVRFWQPEQAACYRWYVAFHYNGSESDVVLTHSSPFFCQNVKMNHL